MISSYKSLNELAAELRALAELKGFRENIKDPTGIEAVGIYVANFHGEASELWEAARAGKLSEPCDKADKMAALGIEPLTCLEEELADMIIRVLDIGDVFGVDIDDAVENGIASRLVDELCLPRDTDIHSVAAMVNAYHAAADDVTAWTRLTPGLMARHVGTLLCIARHIADVFGLDWYEAMVRKHEFNKTRPFRHGGKLV